MSVFSTHPFLLIFGVGCLGVSFLMSGMEAGLFELNRLRLRKLKRSNHYSAKLLLGFLDEPERFLWTILVGNTVANFVAVSLIAVFLLQRLDGHPVLFWGVFLAVMFVFYAACDLLPKMLFRQLPNQLCLWMASPFRWLYGALSPIAALMEALTKGLTRWSGGRTFTGNPFGSREEMRQMMQESAQSLTSEERSMINRVLDLPSLTVRQIATPLHRTVSVNVETPMREVLDLWRERKFSRLPVWRQENNRQVLVGLISLKTVIYIPDLNLDRTAGEFVKPTLYLDGALSLEAALDRLQRSGQRLAIVLGPDHRELGIVSLQDILKFIFGEVSM